MGSTLHAYPHFPFVWSLDRDQNVAKSSKLKHRNSSAVTIRYPAEMFTYIFIWLSQQILHHRRLALDQSQENLGRACRVTPAMLPVKECALRNGVVAWIRQ